jgi:APA family basic amino acid/polyamine antiporter
MPDMPRPYKAFGYPVLPALYIVIASAICLILLIKQPLYSGAGLAIVLIGLPVYGFLKNRYKDIENPGADKPSK